MLTTLAHPSAPDQAPRGVAQLGIRDAHVGRPGDATCGNGLPVARCHVDRIGRGDVKRLASGRARRASLEENARVTRKQAEAAGRFHDPLCATSGQRVTGSCREADRRAANTLRHVGQLFLGFGGLADRTRTSARTSGLRQAGNAGA